MAGAAQTLFNAIGAVVEGSVAPAPNRVHHFVRQYGE